MESLLEARKYNYFFRQSDIYYKLWVDIIQKLVIMINIYVDIYH